MNPSRFAWSQFTNRTTWIFATAVTVAMLALATRTRAAILEDPSGTITTVSTGPQNTYAMAINDAADATQPIGTVWFAWVPGEDFLPTSPISETAPSGWRVNAITHAGSNDGYAIQFVASSASSDIPIGGSLSGFGFTTADTPAQIQGNSPFFPGTPVLTTFAYDAGPFSDAGTEFVVAPAVVPEPTSLAVALLPAATFLLYRRRRAAASVPARS
ncbi:MAG TPA: hypothetical protein VGI81_10900 [Tepidisphaeraceae bacterium]